MYFGHFAAAAAIKAKRPEVPMFPIVMGAGFLDLIDGFLIFSGINKVTPNTAALPYLYFDMNFIDWDHSLLAAVFWSLVWGAFFLKDRRVALVAAVSAFSHFILDWPMHNNDLALFPFSGIHLGLGIWESLGIWSWLLEIVFSAILLVYAWTLSKKNNINLLLPVLFICLLSVQLSPWLSPMKFAAMQAEPSASRLHGILVFAGFIIPSFILIWLYRKAEAE